MKKEIKSKRVNAIIEELKDQYLEEDRYTRPWIIGFSGGKDSTVLLTLVWIAMQQLREEGKALNRNVYVVCNDTMVENPVIEEYVSTVLTTIARAAKEQQMPVSVSTTTPALEDSFWCCVIGKGYPVPNNSFRFCTEKMKIKPTSQFITDQVAADGEAIVLVGTRLTESQARERSIKRHEIKGHRLSKHPLNPNTFTYASYFDFYKLDFFEQTAGFTFDAVQLNSTNDGIHNQFSGTIKETSTFNLGNNFNIVLPLSVKFCGANYEFIPKAGIKFNSSHNINCVCYILTINYKIFLFIIFFH